MDIGQLVLSDDAVKIIDDGTWVSDLPGAEGVSLYVTGLARNQKAQSLIRAKLDAIMKQTGADPDDDDRAVAVREVLAEVVLKDWKGLTQDGKPLKYSKKLARQWLTTRNGDMLAGLVLTAATRIDNNTAQFIENVSKN